MSSGESTHIIYVLIYFYERSFTLLWDFRLRNPCKIFKVCANLRKMFYFCFTINTNHSSIPSTNPPTWSIAIFFWSMWIFCLSTRTCVNRCNRGEKFLGLKCFGEKWKQYTIFYFTPYCHSICKQYDSPMSLIIIKIIANFIHFFAERHIPSIRL